METKKTITNVRTIEVTYQDLVTYWNNNQSARTLTIEQAVANILWLKEHNHPL